MLHCRLRFAARAGALLLSIDSRSTVDRQKLLDPEELAVETERAGFRGAPEEAEMAEAPFCEHISATPIPIQR